LSTLSLFCSLLLRSTWFRYKFDDERVTKEDMKRALEEQYGGEEEVVFLWAQLVIFYFLFFI
jgi:hypothetical protein